MHRPMFLCCLALLMSFLVACGQTQAATTDQASHRIIDDIPTSTAAAAPRVTNAHILADRLRGEPETNDAEQISAINRMMTMIATLEHLHESAPQPLVDHAASSLPHEPEQQAPTTVEIVDSAAIAEEPLMGHTGLNSAAHTMVAAAEVPPVPPMSDEPPPPPPPPPIAEPSSPPVEDQPDTISPATAPDVIIPAAASKSAVDQSDIVEESPPQPQPAAPESSAAVSESPAAPETLADPVHIVIPSIAMDQRLVGVGLTEQRIPIVPNHDAAWYNLSARPGEGENIVLWGHVLRFQYAPEIPAPFARVKELVVGDAITVYTADGQAHQYVVSELVWVTPNQIEYILPVGRERLTLVSCIGDYIIVDGSVENMTHRLIVIALPS